MNLSDATKRISAVQGLIGALPGLAAIISGLGIPPERELLFQSFVISILFILTVFILSLKREIMALETNSKIKFASAFVIFSGVSLLFYLNLYDFVVITDTLTTNAGTFDIELYLPFIPAGELAALIDEIGRHNLVSQGFIEPDIEKYRSENYGGYLLNDVLLILLYLAVVVPLTAALTGTTILLMESDVTD